MLVAVAERCDYISFRDYSDPFSEIKCHWYRVQFKSDPKSVLYCMRLSALPSSYLLIHCHRVNESSNTSYSLTCLTY